MRYEDFDEYSHYMSAAERKKRNTAKATALDDCEPVISKGRNVANTFWGKAWCTHIESFHDYANRLPRGRSYLRQGAVVDMKISEGKIRAQVLGSELYEVNIDITPLDQDKWTGIRKQCTGGISSLIDLIQGRLSPEIIKILCDSETGLFPAHHEIRLDCNCPDWADLCKHLAAVLYGVGSRLDDQPELFFILRGVNQEELLHGDWTGELSTSASLENDNLGDMFGIELDSL